MSGWRDVLARAAAVDPEATRRLPALVALLNAALSPAAGDAGLRALAEEVFGTARRPPFLAALDRAVRGRRDAWDRATLEAVRATLFAVQAVLPGLRPERRLPVDPAPLRRWLERLERQAADLPEAWPGGEACARCGARRCEVVTIEAVAPPQRERRCHACGHAEWWEEG